MSVEHQANISGSRSSDQPTRSSDRLKYFDELIRDAKLDGPIENMTTEDEKNTADEELLALTQILEILQKLEPPARERILQTISTYFRLGREPHLRTQDERPPDTIPGLFSEDRTISPKQFILEKQPKTDVERVACLAYYLKHYRNTPHFKTLDISKLNTEAAQIKFSNAAVAVDNASKTNYLVPATRGNKQLGALGEQFVLALPDREKARVVMSQARPRRKTRRKAIASEEESESADAPQVNK
jgi:hypothetical protein